MSEDLEKGVSVTDPDKHSLIPALEDPAAAKSAAEAITNRNHADYQCYMVLRDLLGTYGPEGLIEALEGRRHRGDFTNDSVEAVAKLVYWTDMRRLYNEILMRIVSGNPIPDWVGADLLKLTSDPDMERLKDKLRPDWVKKS